MAEYREKVCPKCGQKLRIPKKIGGMLMACPSCGNRFQSDFKLGCVNKSEQRSILITVFEMPYQLMQRLWRYLTS